jgi:glycosyltransferase involved in cell wall biosynthesis
MTRRLNVAIVAPTLSILGGQSVQAGQLIAGWQDDPDVHAWLVPINPVSQGPLGALTRVKYARTLVTQASYWPLLWRELRRADVVHVFSASYASFLISPLPAMLVGGWFRKPVLLNYHSGEAPDHLRRSRVARHALAKVPRIVVPSRFLAEVFGEFGLQADVIPNVIDRERFAVRWRERPQARFLSTRNLEPLYNVGCTLRAFGRIQASYPEATLTVVGAGSQDRALRRLAEELRLRGVTFAGRVPPDQMPRYYAAADVYLQSPDIDNMPLSVLEAFSSGLPVVSTEAGGVPAILTHDVHGLLVPLGDDRRLAVEARRLLEEPGLATRLTRAAFESTDRFAWPHVRERWLSAYRRLARVPLASATPLESA